MSKASLSNNNMRIVGRAMPIACLVVITCAQALFDSKEAPEGIYLTFPIALIFGLGFALMGYLSSVIILIFLEFPFKRLVHICLLPYISHDKVLLEWHKNKIKQCAELKMDD
jgi:hypothetical protein